MTNSISQAIVKISQAAATLPYPGDFLQEVVNLLREQLKLHFVFLYLLDSCGEWAHLRAATGRFGEGLVELRYRVAIWSQSPIASTISLDEVQLLTGEACEKDLFIYNALPGSRVQLVLPLRVRKQVIGALQMSSTEASTFKEENLSAFESLAERIVSEYMTLLANVNGGEKPDSLTDCVA